MGILGKAEAAIGVAIIIAAFYGIAKYGQKVGAGLKGIGGGISELLSPTIRPTIGYEWAPPTARAEDRTTTGNGGITPPVVPSPLAPSNGGLTFSLPFIPWDFTIPGIKIPEWRTEDRTTPTPTPTTTTTRTEDRFTEARRELAAIRGY